MADEEQPQDQSAGQQEDVSITKQLGYLAVIRSEAFVEVYANYVSCAISPWDMTLMFGRAVADNPDNPHLEQRASVSLSPQTAKALAHMLLRNLQSYEQQYGEIRYTPLPQPSAEPSA
jgi:Protein of unknown function (DUF3467)